MNNNKNVVLLITLAFVILLFSIPGGAEPNENNSGQTIHYGDEFRQPGLGSCGYGFKNYITGTDFVVDFWLTPAQYQQLIALTEGNQDISIYDAYDQIVPEQIAALPEYVLDILKNRPYTPKGMGYRSYQHPIMTSPEGQVTDAWIDPSGNVVPEKCVPERYLHPDPSDPGFYFIQCYSDGRNPEYTPEMQQHLMNIGLSSAYPADIAATSYFLDYGSYAITLTGSSLSGEELSWTFVLGNDGIWRDEATGMPMNDDARFVLAAMNYVDPPSTYTVNTLTAVAQAKTVSTLPTISSHTSNTLAYTLLSHAGTSKLSKVNIELVRRDQGDHRHDRIHSLARITGY